MVTYQMVAAVVTPRTRPSFLRIAPGPDKADARTGCPGKTHQVEHHRGIEGFPAVFISRLACSMERVAARQTSIVVRIPRRWPRSSR